MIIVTKLVYLGNWFSNASFAINQSPKEIAGIYSQPKIIF